jgi:hypothetical protein
MRSGWKWKRRGRNVAYATRGLAHAHAAKRRTGWKPTWAGQQPVGCLFVAGSFVDTELLPNKLASYNDFFCSLSSESAKLTAVLIG